VLDKVASRPSRRRATSASAYSHKGDLCSSSIGARSTIVAFDRVEFRIAKRRYHDPALKL
jgi:hypothetical protein